MAGQLCRCVHRLLKLNTRLQQFTPLFQIDCVLCENEGGLKNICLFQIRVAGLGCEEGWWEDAAHEVPDLEPRPRPPRPRHLPSPAEDRGLPAQSRPGKQIQIKTKKVFVTMHF